ncbi:hypothetical protein [Paenibacillus sp. FJAT-26967]|uniref:hypothetical protein n=1 Tax=Paenibacillus sp. FJAT-26967 TaxID=1729690 RepID=UPI000837EE17|nr:hypothetical protein [Paenibacillus sp. FJAT-26967]
MNLADMLSYADIHDLNRIADTYACDCNMHSKNELIQSILNTVGRREVFEQRIEDLTMEDVRFLNTLLFDERGSFSLEELVARVQQAKFLKEDKEATNPRDTITKFKKHGWLFHGFSQQTKYLFQVPHDLKRRFGDVLTRNYKSRLSYSSSPNAYRDEQNLLGGDVLHLLRFVRDHEVLLTHDDTMYKRQLAQLLSVMAVNEEPVGKTAWRFGYGRKFKEYPNRFSLIYDYCYFQGLLQERSGILRITESGADIAARGLQADPAELYRFWLRLYKGPVYNLQPIVQWISRLAGDWVSTASLAEVLCPLIRPFYYDTPESIFEQRIIRMMMHLGLLAIGEEDAAGQVIRMTTQGKLIIAGNKVAEEDAIEL